MFNEPRTGLCTGGKDVVSTSKKVESMSKEMPHMSHSVREWEGEVGSHPGRSGGASQRQHHCTDLSHVTLIPLLCSSKLSSEPLCLLPKESRLGKKDISQDMSVCKRIE